MICVDSSVWIDFFNGESTRETEILIDLLDREPIIVGDLILAEVLQGFHSDRDFAAAKSAFDALFFATIGGREIALAAAQNYRLLRRNGVTVRKTIDVFIATFCILGEHGLLHCDRDFDPMAAHLGLRSI